MHFRIYRISISIIFIGILFIIDAESLFASCKIESGPPKELTEYIQTTRTNLQSLNTKYPNICTQTPSATTNLNKLLSTIDSAGTQVPLMNNIITDFSYNVVTIVQLESSPIVLRHGKLLYDLEKSNIIPTIESLARKCQLDGSARKEIIDILEKNNNLQDFFRSTVIGNVSSATTPLEQAILSHYSQESTASCKDELDISVGIETMMNKTELFGASISQAKERWDESIKLIQGGSKKGTASYNELQTRLFRQELARQGVGKNAMQQMLTNLECAQAKGDEKNNIKQQSLSIEKCKKNYVSGLDGLASMLEGLRWKAKNSDQYISATESGTKKIKTQTDIVELYSTLQSTIKAENNADATTTSIITNLVNIHTSLVGLNLNLEKRIPKMKENCMKGSPSIIGGC